MRKVYNARLRTKILKSGFAQKEVAKKLGWSECKLSRLLRFPLPDEQTAVIEKALSDLTSSN